MIKIKNVAIALSMVGILLASGCAVRGHGAVSGEGADAGVGGEVGGGATKEHHDERRTH